MRKTLLFIAIGLAVVFAAAIFYGDRRWRSGTSDLRERLEAARLPIEPHVFDDGELEGLPAPVQRYFRATLKHGQPIVAAVSVAHTGTFNMGEIADQWKPFTSTQRVITRRPGFDWDGKISILPGVPVRVHDAYVAGEGSLHAAVFGLVSMVDQRGTREMAEGELMRFFAEAVWYPTALLPSQGVIWHAVDEHSARATIRDGDVTLTLLFRFNQNGLVDAVDAEARGRMVGGTVVPTPWQGRFWSYTVRDGMRVPLEGEVAWVLKNGSRPYWRGRITDLSYGFAREPLLKKPPP